MNEFSSHSSDVELWLDCGDFGRVPLSRVTPKSVVAKEACEIPPCDADLVVSIDGHLTSNRVRLTSGFVKGRLAARAISLRDPHTV